MTVLRESQEELHAIRGRREAQQENRAGGDEGEAEEKGGRVVETEVVALFWLIELRKICGISRVIPNLEMFLVNLETVFCKEEILDFCHHSNASKTS